MYQSCAKEAGPSGDEYCLSLIIVEHFKHDSPKPIQKRKPAPQLFKSKQRGLTYGFNRGDYILLHLVTQRPQIGRR